MGAEGAALIGMGLCAAGFFGAALGIAYIFAKTIETVGRQPNAEARVAKYCWIGFALIVVPAPIRDLVYRLIASYRYRWFGRAEVCRVPTAQLQARFIE